KTSCRTRFSHVDPVIFSAITPAIRYPPFEYMKVVPGGSTGSFSIYFAINISRAAVRSAPSAYVRNKHDNGGRSALDAPDVWASNCSTVIPRQLSPTGMVSPKTD